MARTTAASRYAALQARRQPFLDRARRYAALTIPSLLPPVGHSYTSQLPEPYQAFTARLVVNLSSQLLTALLPPGQPFFKLTVPNETLLKGGTMKVDTETEKGLALSELLMQSEVERRAWRAPTNLSLQLLVVTGNVLEQMLPDNRLRAFRLDQYVVARDYTGTVVELVIEEKVSPLSLPEAARALIPDKKRNDAEANIDLYTWCRRQADGKYLIEQEVVGKTVPGSKGKYKVLPFFALRWASIPGEDYGRSKVEEHIGDFRAMENLSKSVLDGAAMAARHVWMVKPNAAGTNLKDKIAKANNGDVITGNPDDVAMLQFENIQGLQLVASEIQTLRENLAAAFLLKAGVVRDSERTTATEVRFMAEELEGTLGGVYSLLSEDMQRARVERLIVQLQSQGRLPPWTKEMVEPSIITGLEALNREKDVIRVQTVLNLIPNMPDEAKDYVPWPDLLKKLFIGVGLPGNVRSDAEVQQIQQVRAMQQAAARGVESAAGAMGEQMAAPEAAE